MTTKIKLPVVFSYAFRPLFLCAIGYALIIITWWTLSILGYTSLSTIAVPAVLWHSHEMLFGFIAAAIGGFLLTAIANWTGRSPVSGQPLMLLTLTWFSGRLVMAFSGLLPYSLVAAVDMSYLLLLLALAGKEIFAVDNQRNYKILLVLTMLILSNLAYHIGNSINFAITEAAIRATLLIISLLIAIIGGRIIPNFTNNWLKQQSQKNTALPTSFNLTDKITLTLTLFLLPFWIGWPNSNFTAILAIAVGIAHAIRLSRWCGLATRHEPLLWILHIGYSWLAIGFTVLGLCIVTKQPQSAAIHALAAGAMTTMILAVAARAALGHTNRALTSPPLLTSCFILITIAAALRVLATFFTFHALLLTLSAAITLLALGLFCWIYAPILLQTEQSQK